MSRTKEESAEVARKWWNKYYKRYGEKGRFIKSCLDCGHAHHELVKCSIEGCDCTGGIDSDSTLFCPKCLEPCKNLSPADWARGISPCGCDRTDF